MLKFRRPIVPQVPAATLAPKTHPVHFAMCYILVDTHGFVDQITCTAMCHPFQRCAYPGSPQAISLCQVNMSSQTEETTGAFQPVCKDITVMQDNVNGHQILIGCTWTHAAFPRHYSHVVCTFAARHVGNALWPCGLGSSIAPLAFFFHRRHCHNVDHDVTRG